MKALDEEIPLPDERPVPKPQPAERVMGRKKLPYHPGYLLLITVGSIFVSEAFIMLVLSVLPPLTPVQGAFFDALFLAILMCPALYLLLLRPVRLLIQRQRQLISELRDALSRARTLRGLLPICAHCKKIRDDKGYWKKLEVYIRDHSEADFTHGLCPDCASKLYPEYCKKKV